MGNVIFVVIFVIFCAFLLGAGLISKRWVKESSDFVLAGREISTPINVVGVIAIGFAGTTVTLAPGPSRFSTACWAAWVGVSSTRCAAC